MPKPFENLRENLLRAGIAPRHVRAYLAELREHLADLTERECAAGGDARQALQRARAALGDDDTLAAAMLARRGVRSLTARAPWLVLGVALPLSAIAMVIVAVLLSLLVLVVLQQNLGLDASQSGAAIFALGNLVATPAAATLFALIAWRQRVAPAWLLLGCVIVLLLYPHMTFGRVAPVPGNFPPGLRLQYRWNPQAFLGVSLFPPFHPRAWAIMAAQWPVVTAQYVLTLLPALWLWFAERRAVRSAA